jgi:hypothetical protein
VVGEFSEKEFVAEAFRMSSAAQKHEKTADLRVGVDDNAIAERKIGFHPTMEFAAVAIDGGVNGLENFYMQNGALRESVGGIGSGRTKASLKIKREYGSCLNFERLDS